MNRTYGRYPAPDPRDRRYLIQRQETRRAYRYWSRSCWTGDQGATPQCVGYAWAHWLANEPLTQRLDPTGIYQFAQQLDEWDGTDYDGTSVRAGAKVLRSLGFVREFRWAANLNQLVYAVAEVGPVVCGTDWTSGMESVGSDGYVSATGNILGGHAWLIDGVNLSRGVFRLKNSWGESWGKRGRAWIGFGDVQRLMPGGEFCLAIEARPNE